MADLNIEIDPELIQPNSHKSKKERDKLSPVVKKGGIASTQKPLGQKFKETFVSDDMNDIKDYVFLDIIIPGIKNTLLDIMEMAFFGSSSGRSRRSGSSSRTNYRSYYGDRRSSPSENNRHKNRERTSKRRDDRLDYRNIVLTYRDECEEVIEEMRKRIRKQGSVSIADLFDLIGEEEINYNDNDWGWDDERDISLRRVSNGYLIVVPEAYYLN